MEDEKQDEEEEAPAAEEETDVEPPQAPPTDDEGNGEVYCQKCQSGMIANSLGELPRKTYDIVCSPPASSSSDELPMCCVQPVSLGDATSRATRGPTISKRRNCITDVRVP